MRRFMLALATAALAVTTLAAPAAAAPGAKPGSDSIVDLVLANDGEFDILQAAVIEAGLAGPLDGRRQLTVFAPTDAAFVATFDDILNADLTEQDVISFIEAGGVDEALGAGALKDILLYHVTAGRRISPSVLAAPGYRMLNGEWLSRAELLDAGVVKTDIPASNGVIHVIGSVLIP